MKKKLIHLLLVEDNPAEARLCMEMLKEVGPGKLKALHVQSLRQARQRISQLQLDVVLLDLSLPDSSGLNTLTEIRRAGPELPVLVLTGNEDEALAVQAVRGGAEDYLFKSDLQGALLFRAIQYAIQRKKNEAERERLIRELQAALGEVKRLSGLLPICAACKSIRNDQGYWQQIERYMAEHAEVQFSHGICPECMRKLYPELYEDREE